MKELEFNSDQKTKIAGLNKAFSKKILSFGFRIVHSIKKQKKIIYIVITNREELNITPIGDSTNPKNFDLNKQEYLHFHFGYCSL